MTSRALNEDSTGRGGERMTKRRRQQGMEESSVFARVRVKRQDQLHFHDVIGACFCSPDTARCHHLLQPSSLHEQLVPFTRIAAFSIERLNHGTLHLQSVAPIHVTHTTAERAAPPARTRSEGYVGVRATTQDAASA